MCAANTGMTWLGWVVSIYGAIVASSVAVLRLLDHRRDRAKIVVRLERRNVITSRGPVPKFVLKIVNDGRRLVTIEKVAVQPKQGESYKSDSHISLIPGYFPLALKEGGQSFKQEINAPLTDRGFPWMEMRLKRIYALDSTGKRWNMRRKYVRRLQSQIRKYWEEHQ